MLRFTATPDPRENTTNNAPDNPKPSHDDPAVPRSRCAVDQRKTSPVKRLGVRLFKD